MKKISGLVESALVRNITSPRTGVSVRDSDKELISYIIQMRLKEAHVDLLTPEQLEIVRSMNFESIRRMRQKLQEQGKYLPSPEVARQRKLKSYEVQQVAPSESASGLQRRIENN